MTEPMALPDALFHTRAGRVLRVTCRRHGCTNFLVHRQGGVGRSKEFCSDACKRACWDYENRVRRAASQRLRRADARWKSKG